MLVSAAPTGFLQELKAAYNDVLDQRKNLDSKASSVIATSSTISSLLFGFGAFILTKIDPAYSLLLPASVTLIFAVVVNIASVFFSLRAFKTEGYYYVMTHDIFFQKQQNTKMDVKNESFNEDVIEQFKKASSIEFEDLMIHDYLKCNLFNTKHNASKVKKLTVAQTLLLIGILLVPLLLVILFHASMSKAIHIGQL